MIKKQKEDRARLQAFRRDVSNIFLCTLSVPICIWDLNKKSVF